MIFKIKKKKIYLCNEVYGSETIKINSMILWVFNEYKLRKPKLIDFIFLYFLLNLCMNTRFEIYK